MTHEKLKEHYEVYLKENETFEVKGVKAAAGRARKALGEISKLVKLRRKEIQDKKSTM